MIIGIGVDIAETERVDKLCEKYGERFAAKEAVAKACGTGIGAELGFHDMQIEHDAQGKPLLRFLESANALVQRLQVRNALISLSDERHYVVAMAVLES